MVHLLLLAPVTEEVAEVPVIVVVVVVTVVGATRVVDMMVAVGAVVVVALTVVIVSIGVMVLTVRVLHLLWRLFHPMMVRAVTLLHPWGMEWKQFPRLQAMLVVHLRMVVPQGVMAVMHRALVVGVVEVVATMVVVLLDARNLVMKMHLLKKSSSATRIVMKLVIMPEYISIIYLRM